MIDNAYQGRLQAAFARAVEWHAKQVRKSTEIPYLSHLMAVAAIVMENGGTEDEVIAGLLHDAVEDAGGLTTLEKIRTEFGPDVAAIVDGCTDCYTDPKPDWRPRKEAYIAHVASASGAVRMVSAADKLHNARSILADYRRIGPQLWSRFTGRRDGTLWYYRALVKAFTTAGRTPLVDELDAVVTQLESEVAAREGHPGDGGCPICQDSDYNVDTFYCEKCDDFIVNCPLCNSTIHYDHDYHPCDCVVGIYGYGPGEFSHETEQFVAWRRKHLRPLDFDPDEMDDPSEEPHEVKQLAEETSWMQVMIVGDDGAFGHSNPDVYFLVQSSDQSKLKK